MSKAKLLTTKQVRNIIHANGGGEYGIYTNKTAGHTGMDRRVKCYYGNNETLYRALKKAAGAENVTLTSGGGGWAGPGLTVKCVLG